MPHNCRSPTWSRPITSHQTGDMSSPVEPRAIVGGFAGSHPRLTLLCIPTSGAAWSLAQRWR